MATVALVGREHISVKTYWSEDLVRTLMSGESIINSPETRLILCNLPSREHDIAIY